MDLARKLARRSLGSILFAESWRISVSKLMFVVVPIFDSSAAVCLVNLITWTEGSFKISQKTKEGGVCSLWLMSGIVLQKKIFV